MGTHGKALLGQVYGELGRGGQAKERDAQGFSNGEGREDIGVGASMSLEYKMRRQR